MEYYVRKGIATNLLSKCNAQTFKFIGGYGEGYFITDNVQYTSGSTLVLSVPSYLVDEFGNYVVDEDGNYQLDVVSAVLYVIDVTEIEHPSATKKTRILHTGEEKFYLTVSAVQRNYNVIHRMTQIANTAAILPPDSTPKTLEQILVDILPGLIYSGPTVYPYDVFIQGMSILDAVDKLCTAYGLVWSYQAGVARVYSVVTPVSEDYRNMVDIQKQTLNEPFSSIVTTFPILNCCQQYPNDFEDYSWSSGLAGDYLQVYMPYFPAIYDSSGSLTNSTALAALANMLRPFYQAADKICGDYIAHEFYKSFSLTDKPVTSKITYADLGSGPRTFLSGSPYPFIKKPVIEQPLDRQCTEWIGYLYQDYKGIVTGFWVVPAYGLDGLAPSSNQYVTNLFKWNYGKSPATVYVKWDCVNYRWIAIQQEYVCPPTSSPPPPDPPPAPPSYGELAGM